MSMPLPVTLLVLDICIYAVESARVASCCREIGLMLRDGNMRLILKVVMATDSIGGFGNR